MCLHDNLHNAILPNAFLLNGILPNANLPMAFDLFVQLSAVELW